MEKKKQIVTYDPSAHHYSQEDPAQLVEVEPGHFVRCDTRELTEYRKICGTFEEGGK